MGRCDMQKPKVLLVTGLLSPFQVEFADEVNRHASFDYYVAFTQPYNERRGKHWMSAEINSEFICIAPRDISIKEQALWARDIVRKVNPDIIILAYYRGPIYKQVYKEALF